MSVQDYRINAEIRRLLVSRWVDIAQLQIGTTRGVVYILGHLETTMGDPARRQLDAPYHDPGERALQLVKALDRELRRMRNVRDVVFRLDNVTKRGGRWRASDSLIIDRKSQAAALRPPRARMEVGAGSNAGSEGGRS